MRLVWVERLLWEDRLTVGIDSLTTDGEAVHALGERHPGLTLLHGTELNIDPEGEVDWPEEFLSGFDICVASIHSHFTQSPRLP